MASKQTPGKATIRKARISTKMLRESSAKATKAASKRAYKSVRSLIVVKKGQLVRVDSKGKVVEVLKNLKAPKL